MTEPLSIYQREVWTTFDHHLRWSVFCRILHAIIILKMFPYGWREVKSGEELRELFTPPNALFIGVCGGWVKSEEYLAKFSATTPLSLHSFYLFSECDCKSTQFPRRFQLFPTIPLRYSGKWGKKKSKRGKEWGKRRTPEKILRNPSNPQLFCCSGA